MFKFVRSCTLFAAFVSLISVAGAHAQTTETPLDRTLSHIDFALSVPFELTASSSGKNNISDSVSTAAGALVTLRYTHSPLIGMEMNYKRSRLTYTYTYPAYTSPITPPTSTQLGVEANVSELSWGYVAHAPSSYFGFKPFGGVGLGTTEFNPTPFGGEGLQRQFRASYYWHLGADYTILGSHFGVRTQVRQIFFIAPDFGQNYITSGARTSTFEPSFGLFARF